MYGHGYLRALGGNRNLRGYSPEKDFPSLRQFNVTYIFYLGFYRSDVLDLHIF